MAAPVSELRVANWIVEKLPELEWFISSQGGFYTRHNDVVIHISMAGLLLAQGMKQCRIRMPDEIKRLKDASDYTKMELRAALLKIREAAGEQCVRQADDPNGHNDRMRRELFERLTDGNPF